MSDKVRINYLPTGVPGLDELLGGGLSEFSFNLIAGAPGSGKTTLAHQIMFALATPERRALYFTVLGEPPLKMLRYQQQFRFFDVKKVNESVRFINVADDVLKGGLTEVLTRITRDVETEAPGLVIVDSFGSVVSAAANADAAQTDLQQFVQQLGIRLTGWEATTFLVGEFEPSQREHSPVFTVADGIFWVFQSLDRNSMVRKMQVMKVRGQAPIPGLHTFRITNDGIHVFPRVIVQEEKLTSESAPKRRARHARVSTGVKGLDKMLHGGIPEGYSVLVAGPTGSGKTLLATEFISEGARNDEPGVIAVFEKRPSEYFQTVGGDINDFVHDGCVQLIHTRPLDLSIDETLYELSSAIQRIKARRVVIDSLSGFELALAPTFREEFRESLYRMVAVLTGMGVTLLLTAELEDRYFDLRFSPHGTAFLTDAIIVQRYVELDGQFKRVMGVVKVRGSAHSKELRLFDITDDGIVVGDALPEYQALLTGNPQPSARPARPSKRQVPKQPRSRH